MVKHAATRSILILSLLIMSGWTASASMSHDTNAQASVYYVDQGHSEANDGNDGSEGSPWLTIQKAANTASAGDVVYIKDGTYYEIVTAQHSGSAGSPITFQAYSGHSPVLDGTGHGGWYGVFTIQGKDYIRLEGLEIRNNDTGWGVLVEHEDGNAGNAATNVELVDLEVHHTGGEAIQIRGNAHHVLVQDCTVHDGATYSGIDIYQWDDGRPHHVTVTGCTAYSYPGFAGIASEQADNLVVENNVTYDSALGIDIGSGDDNVIRNNIVHDCDTGIALSSNEDSEVYSNTVYNIYDEAIYSYYWSTHSEDHAGNKWYNNTVYNAGFGIYESNVRYDPGPSSDHEYYNNLFYNIGTHGSYRTPFYFRGTTDLKFYNNTLYLNPNYDAVELVNGSVNADVRDNIISTSGSVSPVVIDGSSSGAIVDYNCYHNRSGSSAGPGAHSVTADPKFTPDFHLQSDSPCIDGGVDLSTHHTTDKDGVSRPQGAGWDIGAYEFAPALELRGTPGNQTIYLEWAVNASLAATSTWQISYYTDTAASPVVETDTLTNTARAYTLAGLENGHWYTVTLTSVGVTPPLSDTVAVRLLEHFVYLPLVRMPDAYMAQAQGGPSGHGATRAEIHVYPGQSIQAALDTAQPGDTVTVHAGTYHESLTVPSGDATNTLTLRAAEGERVVLTGMGVITGWTPYTGSVWMTTTAYEPTKLIVRAQEQPLAREPNEGWWDPETVDLSGPNPVFSDPAHLQGFPHDMAGGEAFVFKRAAFVYHAYPIQSFDPVDGRFTLSTTTANFSVDDIYWLQGRKELIDRPGEWAVEDATGGLYNVYFWPVSVDDLAGVETPLETHQLIDVNGGQNVHIEGFEVTGSKLYGIYVHHNSQDVTVERCLVHHIYHAGIYVRYSQNVRVANNVMMHNRYGFTSDNDTGLVVEENEIAWNSEDGLKVSFDSTDVTVQRNFLHNHISWDHPDGFQTYAYPNNLRYIDNLSIVAGQVFMASDTYDVVFRGNMTVGTWGSGLIVGTGSYNWDVLSNTMAFAGYWPLSLGADGYSFDVRENIFVNGHTNYLLRVRASQQYVGDRNLFWKSDRLDSTHILTYEDNWSLTLEQFQGLTGQEMNSANASPLFRSAPILLTQVDERLIHQCTRDTLILRGATQGWQVGDVVDVNLDGVPRTVTAIDGKAITFTPPLDQKPISYAFVANWGPGTTNLVLDLRLLNGSPAVGMGADGGTIGSQIDIAAYCRGDFDGDGVRDIPVLPPELVHVGYAGCPRQPELGLQGAPADQAIRLAWTVTGALPVTSTWRIDYYTTTAAVFTATDPLSITRAYTLTGLTNYDWYTVTLNAMVDSTPFLTDTVRVMPTDIFVHLPIVVKEN